MVKSKHELGLYKGFYCWCPKVKIQQFHLLHCQKRVLSQNCHLNWVEHPKVFQRFFALIGLLKSLYRSHAWSHFYGAEYEIWANFWPIDRIYSKKFWANHEQLLRLRFNKFICLIQPKSLNRSHAGSHMNMIFGLILGQLTVHSEKKFWADYEQLLRLVFRGKKMVKFF